LAETQLPVLEKTWNTRPRTPPVGGKFGKMLHSEIVPRTYLHQRLQVNLAIVSSCSESILFSAFPDADVVGMYRATTPILLLRDPEMVKEVTVKSFSSFHDNDICIDKDVDAIFGRNPFVLKGEEWKMVRGQLTPAFTSGKVSITTPFHSIVLTKYFR
jgi:hypothetical protein